MRPIRLLAALATAAALAQPALAVPFARADRNNDGLVTFPEARTVMNRLSEVHFEKCDSDGDGMLDRTEFLCLSSLYDTLYRTGNR